MPTTNIYSKYITLQYNFSVMYKTYQSKVRFFMFFMITQCDSSEHTHTHHEHLCCGARGAVWGSVPCSRTPQSLYIYIYISGGPLSALTCCVNVRLLSAIKKISPLIYSQSWVGSWVYTTQAMMTFTLIF